MNRMFQNPGSNEFPRSSPPFSANRPNQPQPRQGGAFPHAGAGINGPFNTAPLPPPMQQGAFQGPMNQQRGPMPKQSRNKGMPFGQSQNADTQQKGGLLSKLLKKSGNNQAVPTGSPFSLPNNGARGAGVAAAAATAEAAAGGGILQSLLNPANLTNMLNNTQKVLQAAESFGPLIQQYGPMVKNIPALWKLYRGMKDTDSPEPAIIVKEETRTSAPVQTATQVIEPPKQKQRKIIQNRPSHAKETVPIQPHIKPIRKELNVSAPAFREGESRPKLFV